VTLNCTIKIILRAWCLHNCLFAYLLQILWLGLSQRFYVGLVILLYFIVLHFIVGLVSSAVSRPCLTLSLLLSLLLNYVLTYLLTYLLDSLDRCNTREACMSGSENEHETEPAVHSRKTAQLLVQARCAQPRRAVQCDLRPTWTPHNDHPAASPQAAAPPTTLSARPCAGPTTSCPAMTTSNCDVKLQYRKHVNTTKARPPTTSGPAIRISNGDENI